MLSKYCSAGFVRQGRAPIGRPPHLFRRHLPPPAIITNFFQLPLKTLKFQPSIFSHCENMARTGLFRALLLVFYPFLSVFTAIFTKANFTSSWNPWGSRVPEDAWNMFPFIRDYPRLIRRREPHMIKKCWRVKWGCLSPKIWKLQWTENPWNRLIPRVSAW